jgi:2,4-dienoyl-CoA reductase (NADPH2)
MKYPNLFSETSLGSLTLPNRIKMAAMSSGLADAKGFITGEQIAYYEARARGGVGLVTVEFACVDSRHGLSEKTQVALDRDESIPGHVRLVEAITAHGAAAGIQLQLPGQFAHRVPGLIPVAPSEVISRRDGKPRARALTGDEVLELVERFADAARRAVEAGYGLIELHGAHGYLLHAFLSPTMNHRDDAWGGDPERRLAFPRAVIAAVRQAIGDRPLVYRFSAEEFRPGGLSIEDTERIAPELVDAGVDGLDVSTGSLTGSLERTIDPMSEEGWRFALARRIRDAAGVPVAVIGSRWPETAEAALERGDADTIALGRALLADADWARKAREGQRERIRPCTSCNWCVDRVFQHLSTGCAEDPHSGRETVPLMPPDAGQSRRLVVIGSGPGGLAAAVQAKSVGFDVTLFERDEELGGGLITSAAPPHKDTLLWYRDYLTGRADAAGIAIRRGAAAELDDVLQLDPFAVIQAQGTSELSLGLPGEDGATVVSAYELLKGRGPARDSWQGPAVVYGGGETGCETAELLAAHGLDVTLISRSPDTEMARAAEALYRKVLVGRLRANPRVTVMTQTHLADITATDVGTVGPDGETRVSAGMVVLAQGRQSNTELFDELTAHGVRSILIGDAQQINRIGEAVHGANAAIRDLVATGAEAPPA